MMIRVVFLVMLVAIAHGFVPASPVRAKMGQVGGCDLACR
jgi:hypothetical protein